MLESVHTENAKKKQVTMGIGDADDLLTHNGRGLETVHQSDTLSPIPSRGGCGSSVGNCIQFVRGQVQYYVDFTIFGLFLCLENQTNISSFVFYFLFL